MIKFFAFMFILTFAYGAMFNYLSDVWKAAIWTCIFWIMVYGITYYQNKWILRMIRKQRKQSS
jgi:Kef-type K+ transport system membrane component KefB